MTEGEGQVTEGEGSEQRKAAGAGQSWGQGMEAGAGSPPCSRPSVLSAGGAAGRRPWRPRRAHLGPTGRTAGAPRSVAAAARRRPACCPRTVPLGAGSRRLSGTAGRGRGWQRWGRAGQRRWAGQSPQGGDCRAGQGRGRAGRQFCRGGDCRAGKGGSGGWGGRVHANETTEDAMPARVPACLDMPPRASQAPLLRRPASAAVHLNPSIPHSPPHPTPHTRTCCRPPSSSGAEKGLITYCCRALSLYMKCSSGVVPKRPPPAAAGSASTASKAPSPPLLLASRPPPPASCCSRAAHCTNACSAPMASSCCCQCAAAAARAPGSGMPPQSSTMAVWVGASTYLM